MSQTHDPSKSTVTFLCTRELIFRIAQYVDSIKTNRNVWLNQLITAELDRLGVELTPENREKARQITLDEIKRRGLKYTGTDTFTVIRRGRGPTKFHHKK